MEFRIADTFTGSLARLTGKEQTAIKTTAFDLQVNPANPGMQFHKLEKAKDPNFWSVRVSRDIRLIVHKTDASLLLCYVDHHDKAYNWAERRRIERHPKTGAAQIVEIREIVREMEIPRYTEAAEPKGVEIDARRLFGDLTDDALLGFGVPDDWISDVKEATEESFLELAEHLPDEASEALLELATGGTPQPLVQASVDADPFVHPDAQRRFRVMTNAAELERALEYPWDKWAVFLHPAQREIVEREFSGPARVSGSAGTGKTIVALHRAVYLARTNADARVLLTTFSIALARLLRQKVRLLTGNDPSVENRIIVKTVDDAGVELYELFHGTPRVATPAMIRTLLGTASQKSDPHRFSLHFIETEWKDVVDERQVETWEDYRDIKRLGRKTRIGEKQRAQLWSIFDRMRTDLHESGLVTMPAVFADVSKHFLVHGDRKYDYIVIDESQDIGVAQLQFLAVLGGDRPNALFFAGDLGQRIFRTPFSWKSLGVDVRGRSRTLRVNYRTSHQIRRQADRLLPPELADVDGNTESRLETVSVFNGPDPEIRTADSIEAENRIIKEWLTECTKDGVLPHEIGVFVRSGDELSRARQAVSSAGLGAIEIDASKGMAEGKVAISTMHYAKGLEFRAVVVAACDDEVLPLQSRIQEVADVADLEDVYNTERHLLYVACTRARDKLLITGVEPASEFLDDLRASHDGASCD